MKTHFIIYFLFVFGLTFFAACNGDEKTKDDKKNIINSAENASSQTPYLDSLITADPENPENYYQRARYFHDRKIHPKALLDILKAIQINSSNPTYYLLAGDVYIAMNQGKEAMNVISEAINNIPKNEDLYTRAIEYNIYMKNEQAAMNFTNDLLRINQNNADAYFFKGLIHKKTNKAKAISSFQTCVEQDPTYYNAYMQLGTLLSEDKNDLALKYFENAFKLDTNSREALYGKAYHYQNKQQYNDAKAAYKRMIIKDKKDFQAFYNIGHCFLAQDSLMKAEKHFDVALGLKPDYVDAIFMLGQIAARKGDKKAAKVHYQNALKLLPNNATIEEALKEVQ